VRIIATRHSRAVVATFILFSQAMDARDVDFAAKSWRKMLSDLDLLPFTGCIVFSIVFPCHKYARKVQVDHLFAFLFQNPIIISMVYLHFPCIIFSYSSVHNSLHPLALFFQLQLHSHRL